MSLGHRLKFFNICVTPSLLFGLSVLPLSHTQLKEMDALQRKMLRRIVGWRRIADEPWRLTMTRMNQRLAYGQTTHYCQPWSLASCRAQWRYINHVIRAHPLLWARGLCNYNFNPVIDPLSPIFPLRKIGRPKMHWDHHVQHFCWTKWSALQGQHWFRILNNLDMKDLEDEFCLYVARV